MLQALDSHQDPHFKSVQYEMASQNVRKSCVKEASWQAVCVVPCGDCRSFEFLVLDTERCRMLATVRPARHRDASVRSRQRSGHRPQC